MAAEILRADEPRGPEKRRLLRLMAAAERLTVDLIAQRPIVCQLESQTPADALDIAAAENFDVLPVEETDGRIVRYVLRDDLETHRSDPWDQVEFKAIRPDEIVSSVNPLLDLLDRFDPSTPRLFVLGRQHIDRIVTVYDLNQPAAHHFAFALAIVVEAALARAIEERARVETRSPDEDVAVDADRWIREQVLELSNRYSHAKARAEAWHAKTERGTQVRLTSELLLQDKIALIDRIGLTNDLARRCRQPYCRSDKELLAALDRVRKLRNAVAHDREELADEWSVCTWMRTTYHLAQDLASE
jgi:hypothetical protein